MRKFFYGAIPSVTLFIAFLFFIKSVSTSSSIVLQFEWRWFAALVMVAIAITGVLLSLLFRMSTSIRGAVYWFAVLLICNLTWLLFTLAQVLSATPAAAAFWQGLLPLGWIPIPVAMLFFVICYIDDTDLPMSFGSWAFTLAPVGLLLYIAGSTNLVENHGPANPTLEYWGYQSDPGTFAIYIYAWLIIMAVTCFLLLVNAYRRAISSSVKRQLKIFIFGISQYILVAILIDLIAFQIDPSLFPPAAFFYTTVLSLAIGYGILRHGIFQINPASLAEPILQNLSEAVLAVNTQMHIEFTNMSAQKMFAYSPDVMKGMPVSRLFNKQTNVDIHRLLQTSSIVGLDEVMMLTRHHELIPVSCTIRRISETGSDSQGYIFVIQNISELKKKANELLLEKRSVERKVAERTRQLHDERARLSASIESLSFGFMLVDNENNIIVQNHTLSKILGTGQFSSVAEMNTKIDSMDVVAYCDRIRKGTRQQKPKEIMYDTVTLRIFGTKVSDEAGGKGSSVVLLIEDITDIKLLERSRDEFFSIASHELRTPLTAIRGNASMIREYMTNDNDTDLNEAVDDIHEASVRLIDIVNDFLDVSRLEQGKTLFEFREFSLKEVVDQVVKELSQLTSANTVHIEVVQNSPWPNAWADPGRVKQIMYNLLGNAVKFTRAGSVRVSCEILHDGKAKVIVQDTGIGISQEMQLLLFRKFQQAGDSILTRDTSGGTGLGLYISRLLARAMHGSVDLESSVEHEGSSFSVTLPLASEKNKDRIKAKAPFINKKTGLTTK